MSTCIFRLTTHALSFSAAVGSTTPQGRRQQAESPHQTQAVLGSEVRPRMSTLIEEDLKTLRRGEALQKS